MRPQATLFLSLLCVPACMQRLDENAADGSQASAPSDQSSTELSPGATAQGTGGSSGASAQEENEAAPQLSTVILPGAPPFGFYGSSGALLASEDACDATESQAQQILVKYCADCHGGRTPGERAGTPPFDFVLDIEKLTATYTATTPPRLFVAPGNPAGSRLYLRTRSGEMPPAGQPGLPRPTVSDISVLHEWIAYCLGAKPPAAAGGAAGAGGATSVETDAGSGADAGDADDAGANEPAAAGAPAGLGGRRGR